MARQSRAEHSSITTISPPCPAGVVSNEGLENRNPPRSVLASKGISCREMSHSKSEWYNNKMDGIGFSVESTTIRGEA